MSSKIQRSRFHSTFLTRVSRYFMTITSVTTLSLSRHGLVFLTSAREMYPPRTRKAPKKGEGHTYFYCTTTSSPARRDSFSKIKVRGVRSTYVDCSHEFQ